MRQAYVQLPEIVSECVILEVSSLPSGLRAKAGCGATNCLKSSPSQVGKKNGTKQIIHTYT